MKQIWGLYWRFRCFDIPFENNSYFTPMRALDKQLIDNEMG